MSYPNSFQPSQGTLQNRSCYISLLYCTFEVLRDGHLSVQNLQKL